jgi:hypothetical protein
LGRLLTPFFARTSLITAWLDLRHSLTLDIARKLLRPTKPSEVEVEKKKKEKIGCYCRTRGMDALRLEPLLFSL